MAGTDPREAKLPVWAKTLIADLRRELARTREDFEEFADTATTEDVVAVVNPYDTHPRPAAREGETVRFYLDGLDGYRWIAVRVEDLGVEVMGSTGLRIEPSVTNVLRLSLTRD